MFVTARAQSWLLSLLLSFSAVVPAGVLADEDDRQGLRRPTDRLVIFGTSLSDPGNGHYLNKGNATAPPSWPGVDPLTLVPESEWPYAAGQGRFSNGPVWVEYLAKPIGLSRSARPAWDPRNKGASNFAVGGATAREHTGETTLSQQVRRFIDAGLRTSPETLYVIEIGGNDVSDALGIVAQTGDIGAAVQLVLAPALTSVTDTILTLWSRGAKRFLIWNVPNLGRAPGIARLDAALMQGGRLVQAATALTSIYNNGLPGTAFVGLAGALNELRAMPEIEIVTFDAFGVLESLAIPPLRYGLQDVQHPCISMAPPFVCTNPNRHLFWDGIHPTTAGHAIVAVEVGKALIADLLGH